MPKLSHEALGLLYATSVVVLLVALLVVFRSVFYKFRPHHLGQAAAFQATSIALLALTANGAFHALAIARFPLPEIALWSTKFSGATVCVIAIDACLCAAALFVLMGHAISKETVTFFDNVAIFLWPIGTAIHFEHELNLHFKDLLLPA